MNAQAQQSSGYLRQLPVASWGRACSQRASLPVRSYGMIVRRRAGAGGSKWLYLVVQRRDSYAYVEFIRGRYDLRNREQLIQLMSCMSDEEKQRISSGDFSSAWQGFWRHSPRCMQRSDYTASKQMYDTLVAGYRMRLLAGGEVRISLDSILRETRGRSKEPEWGFPKGRKLHRDEDEMECALRELEEEAGIPRDCLCDTGGHCVQEVYEGSNGEIYHHTYFSADLAPDAAGETKVCEREIRNAMWASPERVLDLMRHRPERCSMFRALEAAL